MPGMCNSICVFDAPGQYFRLFYAPRTLRRSGTIFPNIFRSQDTKKMVLRGQELKDVLLTSLQLRKFCSQFDTLNFTQFKLALFAFLIQHCAYRDKAGADPGCGICGIYHSQYSEKKLKCIIKIVLKKIPIKNPHKKYKKIYFLI